MAFASKIAVSIEETSLVPTREPVGDLRLRIAQHVDGEDAALGDEFLGTCEQRFRAEFGATVVDVKEIIATECDVLAPCALGAALNSGTVDSVRAKIIAGAANNQLGTLEDGDRLAQRGILYLPDFLVNAGGIISVAREFRNEGSEEAVMAEVTQIRERVAELMDRVAQSGVAPARVAHDWASSLLVKPE